MSLRILSVFGLALTLFACEQPASETAANTDPIAAVDLSDVGAVAMENTGAPAAQGDFLRGLAQLHNFQYEDAATLFRAAQAIDPDFALAYWGEAMTHNHAVWFAQDRDKAREILMKLGASDAERVARGNSPYERDLVQAANILYAEVGSKQERDDKYRDHMATMWGTYEGDADIGSLYALSMIGAQHFGRDFPTYEASAALLTPLLARYPRHPGVAHYLIHSTDDPGHAANGLAAARAYSSIAPNSSHAQHMTTHIFLALGMWDDTIAQNETSVAVLNRHRLEDGKPIVNCGHGISWLQYAYQQVGRRDDALKVMTDCASSARAEEAKNLSRLSWYFVFHKELYVFETEDWDGPVAGLTANLEHSPSAAFNSQYLRTFGAYRLGDASAGDRHREATIELMKPVMAEMDEDGHEPDHPDRKIYQVKLMHLEALAATDPASAIAILKDAATLEEAIPHGYGPPHPAKPSHELYAETLLAAGQTAEAAIQFRKALDRMPNRARSVKGLAAAEAAVARSGTDD